MGSKSRNVEIRNPELQKENGIKATASKENKQAKENDKERAKREKRRK